MAFSFAWASAKELKIMLLMYRVGNCGEEEDLVLEFCGGMRL